MDSACSELQKNATVVTIAEAKGIRQVLQSKATGYASLVQSRVEPIVRLAARVSSPGPLPRVERPQLLIQ